MVRAEISESQFFKFANRRRYFCYAIVREITKLKIDQTAQSFRYGFHRIVSNFEDFQIVQITEFIRYLCNTVFTHIDAGQS